MPDFSGQSALRGGLSFLAGYMQAKAAMAQLISQRADAKAIREAEMEFKEKEFELKKYLGEQGIKLQGEEVDLAQKRLDFEVDEAEKGRQQETKMAELQAALDERLKRVEGELKLSEIEEESQQTRQNITLQSGLDIRKIATAAEFDKELQASKNETDLTIQERNAANALEVANVKGQWDERIAAIKAQADSTKDMQEKADASAKAATDLRKEYNTLQSTKDYVKVRDAYKRIQASAQDPSPAGDMSLIFAYMRMLDPTSTVREGEYATAEQAGAVPDRIRNLYNNVVEGYKLTPAQRGDFTDRAQRLWESTEASQMTIAEDYKEIARKAGIEDTSMVVPSSLGGMTLQMQNLIEKIDKARRQDPNVTDEQLIAAMVRNGTDPEMARKAVEHANQR